MKTLYSCGCSFMSVDLINPGINSFLELYANAKNFKHISLGRSGSTNFLIRLQIEEAINQQADYIIIGATSSDRIDIPIFGSKQPTKSYVDITDIEYRGYNSASELNIKTTNPTVISDSINNYTSEYYHSVHNNSTRKEITPYVINSLKHYVADLHHNTIETTKNYFIISDGLRKLMSLNKEFIFIPGPLRYNDWSFIGKHLWQGAQPWDMPLGFSGKTTTHNPQQAHDNFLETLLNITPEWK